MKGGRFVNCIFCDDVRQELGNKLSLMGIYSADLAIQGGDLPFTMPKLVAHFFINSPIKNKIKNMKLWLSFPPGKEIARVESKVSQWVEDGTEGATKVTLGFTVMVAPLQITENGFLEAWVDIDGEVERAGRLHVHVEPASTNKIA